MLARSAQLREIGSGRWSVASLRGARATARTWGALCLVFGRGVLGGNNPYICSFAQGRAPRKQLAQGKGHPSALYLTNVSPNACNVLTTRTLMASCQTTGPATKAQPKGTQIVSSPGVGAVAQRAASAVLSGLAPHRRGRYLKPSAKTTLSNCSDFCTSMMR